MLNSLGSIYVFHFFIFVNNGRRRSKEKNLKKNEQKKENKKEEEKEDESGESRRCYR